MKQNYLYLSKQDKTKLFKQAENKKLSVSTLVNIIAKHYMIFADNKTIDNYLIKGECRILVQPRNENKLNYTDRNLTNVIYLYLHPEKIKEHYNAKFNLTKINRLIQSETDKTLDPNWDLNRIIRANYIAQRKMKGK